jgi:hypothetical protein
MMLRKVILDPDENLSPCVMEWSEEKEDFVIDVPNGISRYDLIDLVNEIKRITGLEDE